MCIRDRVNLVYKTNLERRDRHFSFAIPRNIIANPESAGENILDPTNLDATKLFKDRIRDKYCMLDFKQKVANDEEFAVSYIVNKYRLSYR